MLTERTAHLDAILLALASHVPPPFVLHGRMSKKRRAELIAELDSLAPGAPRILLATGKLVGEGFDHPPLDTLVLAMPVSAPADGALDFAEVAVGEVALKVKKTYPHCVPQFKTLRLCGSCLFPLAASALQAKSLNSRQRNRGSP